MLKWLYWCAHYIHTFFMVADYAYIQVHAVILKTNYLAIRSYRIKLEKHNPQWMITSEEGYIT